MSANMTKRDEFSQFKNLSAKKKVDSMELYLIGCNGYKYNMQEVGERVFGNENYSYTVSLIHRYYNFSGQNGGRYREGCSFERTYGYRVTRKDIEAFVRKYPNGTVDKGVTFEDFLITRVKNAKSPAQKRPKQTSAPVPEDFVSVHRSLDRSSKGISITIGSICGLVLLLLLMTGNLWEYRIISGIALLIMYFAFKW